MARARVYEIAGSDIIAPEGTRYARNRSRGNPDTNIADVSLVDTFDQARRIRETFYGGAMQNAVPLPVRWPRYLRYVGRTNAEQYLSDKKLADWKKQLFKHIAEDVQYLLINDSLMTLLNDRGQQVEFRDTGRRMRSPDDDRVPGVFYCSTWELRGPMPKHISVLAEDKGVQWVTSNGRFWEARLPGCMLAAAPLEDGTSSKPRVILLSYDREGVQYVISGRKLSVTPDGIVH